MAKTGSTESRPPAPADERVRALEGELSRTQAELAALHDERGQLRPPRARHHFLRNASAGVLVFLVALVSAMGLVAVWVSTTVLETDRYVETVEPLASDPEVQNTVAQRVTDQLFAQTDVTTTIRNALPPESQALAVPLTSQVHGFVENQVRALMATSAFTNIWVQANTVTHDQITNLLLNESKTGALVNEGGTVSIDLHSLAVAVLDQLQSTGVTLFDNVSADKVQGSVQLVQSDELGRASTAAETLHTVRYVAPIVLLLLIGLAVFAATNRRVVTAWLGIALIFGMLIVAAGLNFGRDLAVDEAAKVGLQQNAAVSVYDTITRFLERSNAVGFVLGIVVFLTAVFTGSGRAARALKSLVGSMSTGIARWMHQQGWRPATTPAWVSQHLSTVRAVIVIGAAIVAVVWSSPTVAVVLWITFTAVAAAFVAEVMRALDADSAPEMPVLETSADPAVIDVRPDAMNATTNMEDQQ